MNYGAISVREFRMWCDYLEKSHVQTFRMRFKHSICLHSFDIFHLNIIDQHNLLRLPFCNWLWHKPLAVCWWGSEWRNQLSADWFSSFFNQCWGSKNSLISSIVLVLFCEGHDQSCPAMSCVMSVHLNKCLQITYYLDVDVVFSFFSPVPQSLYLCLFSFSFVT